MHLHSHSHTHKSTTHNSHPHSCQIDCTNHDQVITSLELKSKDLYYFWRNYQWLYNKYYNQQQGQQKGEAGRASQQQGQTGPSTGQLSQQIHDLEEDKERLISENRKLKLQLELAIKKGQINSLNTASTSNTKKIEQQYQKQISRLTLKCQQYQKIRQKQQKQILTLTQLIKSKQQSVYDLESKYKREMRRLEDNIVDLQTTIDGLRAKAMNNANVNPNININQGGNQAVVPAQRVLQVQEKSRRQLQKLTILMRNLQQKCSDLIENQFEELRSQLLSQFPEMIGRFSQGDLSAIITEDIYQHDQEFHDEKTRVHVQRS